MQRLSRLGNTALAGRLARETWIRYRVDLAAHVNSSTATPALLTPIGPELIERLAQPPLHNQSQARTAIHLWQHGLRGGYVWMRDGKPLCLQWLFSHHDNRLLQRLPGWSGMYPPLPADHGQVENILTLPAGMRYPGGAASPFTLAMYRLAAEQGMRWLITHIQENNAAAHRWAQRTGWTAYGHIHRYHADLPQLRNWHIYVHDTVAPVVQSPASPKPRSAATFQGAPENGR